MKKIILFLTFIFLLIPIVHSIGGFNSNILYAWTIQYEQNFSSPTNSDWVEFGNGIWTVANEELIENGAGTETYSFIKETGHPADCRIVCNITFDLEISNAWDMCQVGVIGSNNYTTNWYYMPTDESSASGNYILLRNDASNFFVWEDDMEQIGGEIPNKGIANRYTILLNGTDFTLIQNGIWIINTTHTTANINENTFFIGAARDSSGICHIDNLTISKGTTQLTPPSITIHTPLNNSQQSDNPLNFTFEYDGFNPDVCSLYSNISGDFISVDDIISNVTNVTTYYNVTTKIFNNTDAIGIWRLEEGSGNIAYDNSTLTKVNGTITEAIYQHSKGNNETGDYSLKFDGLNDKISLGYNYNFERTNPFSIEFWFATNTTSNDDFISKYGSSKGWTLYMADGKIYFAFSSGTGIYIKKYTNDVYNNGIWRHFAFTYDGSSSAGGALFYINGQTVSTYTESNTLSSGTTINDLECTIASRITALYYEGLMDEILIYNKTLSQSEITKHYNQGLYNYGIEEKYNVTFFNQTLNQSTNYILSHTLPENTIADLLYYINCHNEEDINSSIYTIQYDNDFTAPIINIINPIYNYSYDYIPEIILTTNEYSTCNINDTTYYNLVYTNNTYFIFNASDNTDEWHDYKITCIDNSIHNNTATSTIRFFTDIIQPNIYYLNIVNNQEFYMNETAFINVTSYDVNLYAINQTIYNPNEEVEKSIQIEGIETSYYNLSTNVKLNITGIWFINTTAWDSHTNNKIKNIDIEKTKDTITFDKKIKITGQGALNSNTNKKQDRYTIEFEFNKNHGNKKVFYIESDNDLKLINSKYTAHFVDFANKKWIDFEGLGNNPTITKIYENKYEIDFNTPNNLIIFNSIGELNEVSETRTIILKNIPPSPYNPLNLDFNSTNNILLLALLIILYIGLMALGFAFGNPAFVWFGFFVGFFIGLMINTIHIFLTFLFMFINIGLIINYVRTKH